MGRYALELKMLKRIPARYKSRGVWDGDPPGLERSYGDICRISDPWHLRAKIRTEYCSMDELKAYLEDTHPELVLSPAWSMTGGCGGSDVTVTDAAGTKIRIPYGDYKKLETCHVDERVFECLELCWGLDLGIHDQDWLSPILPAYVDTDLIKKAAAMRIEFARKSTPDERGDRISESGYTSRMSPDVIGFLADGLAEAKHKRCALHASLVD